MPTETSPPVPRVVVHPERPDGVWEALRALADQEPMTLVDAADEQDVVDALQVPGAVLATYRWSPRFLQPGLSLVQAMSTGVDQFPLDEFRRRGIGLCNASGVLADCIAEHALACLFALTRNLPQHRDDQRTGRWTPRVGHELAGATLAVVGLGAVGQQVARLGAAVGMTVLGVRRTPGPIGSVAEVLGPDRLLQVCERADAVVLCLPETASTRGLIGAAELAALGDGWLINVGRGSAVDEFALLHALRRGALRGAALDVVDPEPPPADSGLWNEPRILLTGHSAVLSPRWGTEWTKVLAANLRSERDGTGRVNAVIG